MERQEMLRHWQHSCLSSLFFLFIDWEYYLPLHPAVCTSLATEIYHWLWSNVSIKARGVFCWAAGQRTELEAAAAAEGGSQSGNIHSLWEFPQNAWELPWFSRKWRISGRRRRRQRLSPSISLTGCLSKSVSLSSILTLKQKSLHIYSHAVIIFLSFDDTFFTISH